MDLREFIGTNVKHDGKYWEVKGVGAVVGDKVFCHLASINHGTMQKNGFVPRQIGDFIKIEELTK